MTETLSAWLPETAASRLLGVDLALVSRRASAGKYGPTKRTASGGLLLHVRGLELAARRPFSFGEIQAAIAGQAMPQSLNLEEQFTSKRRRTVEEIGAAVARSPDTIKGA